MQSEIRFQLLKAGRPVANSGRTLARVVGHPGFADFFTDNLTAILETVGEAIGAYLGIPGLSTQDAIKRARAVFSGSSKHYLGRDNLRVVRDGSFEQIQVVFRAWSEDDLKKSTCQVVAVPPAAQAVSRTLNDHLFEVAYNVPADQLGEGLSPFIFGAQDSGWFYDVAVSSELDLTYHIPQPQSPPMRTPAESATRYAQISTLLAETGLGLGSPGANTTDYNAHYNWARATPLRDVTGEMVRKVAAAAADRTAFPLAYALLSVEAAKTTFFANPGRDSKDASAHLNYARDQIARANTTQFVRDELADKVRIALQPAVASDLVAPPPATPPAAVTPLLAQLKDVPTAAPPKTSLPPPPRRVEVAPGVPIDAVGNFTNVPTGFSPGVATLVAVVSGPS
jgi:hypothetical protein